MLLTRLTPKLSPLNQKSTLPLRSILTTYYTYTYTIPSRTTATMTAPRTNPKTKTIVATGASSGLGFELVKTLLATPPPGPLAADRLNLIIGARDVPRTRAACDALLRGAPGAPDARVWVLPLELSDLESVRGFARGVERLGSSSPDSLSGAVEASSAVGGEAVAAAAGGGGGSGKEGGDLRVDYLLLNAAITGGNGPAKRGFGGWSEDVVVNHFSQHYLVHLLRDKLVESRARVVVVSSGAVRRVTDTASLDKDLRAGSGVDSHMAYSQSKFVQLLSAHWWRRQLAGQCAVVAVSPGLIPGTGLGRRSGMKLTMDMPDAKPVSEGAKSILAAFTRDDFPEDPEQIFLTSWGEWWNKDVYAPTLDRALQDRWCPSKEEMEEGAGLSA